MITPPKKGLQAKEADFSVSFRLAPFQAHGSSAVLREANKPHGPRGHCPLCPPPLGGPASSLVDLLIFDQITSLPVF